MSDAKGMERVAELRKQLDAIRLELKDLLKTGFGLPANGAYPVSQSVGLLEAIDDQLEYALVDCGLIDGED